MKITLSPTHKIDLKTPLPPLLKEYHNLMCTWIYYQVGDNISIIVMRGGVAVDQAPQLLVVRIKVFNLYV